MARLDIKAFVHFSALVSVLLLRVGLAHSTSDLEHHVQEFLRAKLANEVQRDWFCECRGEPAHAFSLARDVRLVPGLGNARCRGECLGVWCH